VSRFYVPKNNIKGLCVTIDGNEAHHIIDVMRLCDGDGVVVFDGEGTEYSGTIQTSDSKRKIVTILISGQSKAPAKDLARVTLAQAIPKKAKMDSIVEKATELGVFRIIPMVTDRTIVKPSEIASRKMVERWKKISIGASKQCGRVSIPEVTAIKRFIDVISSFEDYDTVLFACFSEKTVNIKKAIAGRLSGNILALIGPEGDFSPKEITLAARDNCRYISLGQRVLKSDTAGLFLLSVLDYEGN
jgi:16S rRNA (uracil1498-N3)-methyltransferase